MGKDFFQLKAFKAAKVSEISEATAAAPVADEERINFHIGHPIQDERLTSAFRQLVFQVPDAETVRSAQSFERYLSEWQLEDSLAEQARFVYGVIPACNAYAPRGGYNRKNPGTLIERLQQWFEKDQLEPIHYDCGKESGQKELMLGSGGLWENVRVLLFTLQRTLPVLPAHIYLYGLHLPQHLRKIENLIFYDLPLKEEIALTLLQQSAAHEPTFLFVGEHLSERFRRKLRELVLERPVFVIEANDAPNHLSLAREALLADRVLRFLTPGAIRKKLKHLSLMIVAGRADFIQRLETIHFELKGTPSAPESALLEFLLAQPDAESREPLSVPLAEEKEDSLLNALRHSLRTAEKMAQRVSFPDYELPVRRWRSLHQTIEKSLQHLPGPGRQGAAASDTLAVLHPTEVMARFFEHLGDEEWMASLESDFLNAFVHVHPEYDRQRCLAVSGSARTALGLLGFHGPIKKVMSLDLSWTYEHCFPQVEILPLNPLQGLDAARIIAEMEKRIEQDVSWLNQGAFILNNPHNATGRILDETTVREILHWALQRGLTVIDDLSYQNVGPWKQSKKVKTLKEMAIELQKSGLLGRQQSQRLITVHSLSKTDSFAGARLTVVEIPDPGLFKTFAEFLRTIRPHGLALLIAYLFYRNGPQKVQGYWNLRNRLFAERMEALIRAARELPDERNPFRAEILPPQGSMYPLLFIRDLPAGISLNALSSNLANQGIGLIPLTAFARTASGFETARPAFRLTLGGQAHGETLYYQMRRVLIDLNRLIAQESSLFQRKRFAPTVFTANDSAARDLWRSVEQAVIEQADALFKAQKQQTGAEYDRVFERYVRERLRQLGTVFEGRLAQWQRLLNQNPAERAAQLQDLFEFEFYKDHLSERQERFRKRLFDRTVHPTQMFSIQVEGQARLITEKILLQRPVTQKEIFEFAKELLEEFRGRNVAINSVQEADELLLDLDSFIEAEIEAQQAGAQLPMTLLSFWGDWDGSTRPSGQGHRLVAAVVIENVARLSQILSHLHTLEPDLPLDPDLLNAIERFPTRRAKFWNLLNKITTLTNQLEKRYRTLLPTEPQISRWRRLAVKWHLAHDPWAVIWEHNDRLERKMVQLRQQRRQGLEYYFQLNKKLRKTLHGLIPVLLRHTDDARLLYVAGLYRDLLKRFVLTPRIHQNLITSIDPFAIDTTVFNIQEINEIGGRFGNGGLILGLQVSMTSQSEALIRLDQKIRAQKESIERHAQSAILPEIWIIPLFEDFEVVRKIESYLDDLWQYARTHRSALEKAEDRFTDMICEIFIAGSDLSQQVSQPVAAQLYRETKFKVVKWLARKGLLERIRLKLGSGEPMQRQGGFYDALGGLPAFLQDKASRQIIAKHLKPSAAQSTRYAITPLRGVLQSGDLRTFQSTISEKLRQLPALTRAELLFHITRHQRYHDRELIRAGEPLILTRLKFHERGEKELKRLTMGWHDPVFDRFLQLVRKNFREILYGREEDVVGIHVVSYFISRMTPSFRDRPTVRPSSATGQEAGQRIINRLSRVLPLAKYGTMLRAIGHNRAQTMILGINQLTVGLFRALKEFAGSQDDSTSARLLIQERILPFLPVYEILHTLRLYQDTRLEFFRPLQSFFPPGNSAVAALHEDLELMREYIPLFQWELLKRHGLSPAEFTKNGRFKQALLPALRPDLAVLLQNDLFNTRLKILLAENIRAVNDDWQKEVADLLQIPEQIYRWRQKIWQLIADKIARQVESFNQLALAISVLLNNHVNGTPHLDRNLSRLQRTSSQLSSGLQNLSDENLKQFLLAAVQFLGSATQGVSELPVNVMRALRDVERIVKIEQQPLSAAEQEQLRFYILQMARLSGENG